MVWLFDRWMQARRRHRLAAAPPVAPGAPGPKARQQIRWGWLYLTALISALSHLLLDWTNNYGLRAVFSL